MVLYMALWMLRFSVITEVYNIRMTFTGEKLVAFQEQSFTMLEYLGKQFVAFQCYSWV